jgi:hypothetical protein
MLSSKLFVAFTVLTQLATGGCGQESTDPLEAAMAATEGGSEATDPAVAPFVGTYRSVGGEQQLSLRDEAIDAATADMNILSRTIARDKLRETTPIAKKVVFAGQGKLLTISADERSFTASTDGSVAKVKEIEQKFAGDGKVRINRYRLDGRKLIVSVTIRSDKLPKPVEYELTYERE